MAFLTTNLSAKEVVNTVEGTWNYFASGNDDNTKPDYSAKRTLKIYDDGSYEILNAFGSDNEADVLTFVLTKDNLTFQGLSSYNDAKYIYYDGDDNYAYVYDSECYDGDYSSYSSEDGKESIWFWVSGGELYGWINFVWDTPPTVKAVEATWNFYESTNDDYTKPDKSEKRTLKIYSDGKYVILNAFGSDNEADVLTFVLTTDNFTFQGLSSYDGAKYIYYDGDDKYSYVYDSECSNGAYSSYANEDGEESIWFWISGTAGDGYINLIWSEKTASIKDLVEDNNAPEQFFNLQGMPVNPDNMVPGIYIKKAGSKTQKILVK